MTSSKIWTAYAPDDQYRQLYFLTKLGLFTITSTHGAWALGSPQPADHNFKKLIFTLRNTRTPLTMVVNIALKYGWANVIARACGAPYIRVSPAKNVEKAITVVTATDPDSVQVQPYDHVFDVVGWASTTVSDLQLEDFTEVPWRTPQAISYTQMLLIRALRLTGFGVVRTSPSLKASLGSSCITVLQSPASLYKKQAKLTDEKNL